MEIKIPKRDKGRQSMAKVAAYETQLEAFCGRIKQIASTLDFDVSSRGWCYLLEEYGLSKGNFDVAQRLINDCRKSGLLPLDICAEDGSRITENVDEVSDDGVDEYADEIVDYVRNHASGEYHPLDVWSDQSYYVEMLVEKIDLKGIFRPICEKYHVPFTNARGWMDLNSRAELMGRFAKREADDKQCVLLYCGDHDPGGLIIAETLRSNLADLSDAVDWWPDGLIIDHFGLHYDFIEANGIKWIENLYTSAKDKTDADGKKVKALPLDDPRHKDHNKEYVQLYLRKYGARKVEANALVTRVDAGRRLCEEAILRYVDPEAIDKWNQDTIIVRRDLQSKIMERLSA